MITISRQRYREAVNRAQVLINEGFTVIDTETTGFRNGRVVEIAIAQSLDGVTKVLLDQRIKPSIPIETQASEVHGITDADVAQCPSLSQVWLDVLRATSGTNNLVVYNLPYDRTVLKNSMRDDGIKLAFCQSSSRPGKVWHTGALMVCAMQIYAQYYGEPKSNGGVKNKKLPAATGVAPHSAVGDCISTIELIKGIALESLPVFQ
ncbi:3'-5' exonuclease [Leptolyngbyaceae cyanobacterium CCMR0082]|uniref:3'-5' exonuclease n=1 Tax=Adonisia turfae CCMR0082 TaxID=2304604 RepID=A0A6M0SAR5_9CYAN|nr:3'-5' exonuclease [Adonisia turfae]NEZ65595.1 3'-5' exonuclease [Adonisia turfae CCMR0082]